MEELPVQPLAYGSRRLSSSFPEHDDDGDDRRRERRAGLDEDGDAGDDGDDEEEQDEEALHAFFLVESFVCLDAAGRMKLHLALLGGCVCVDQLSEDGDVKVMALISSRGLPLKKAIIGTSTQMHFLHQGYNIVLAVDMTPSMASVSPHRGSVLLDQLFECVDRIIRVVLRPLHLPECADDSQPDILLSVIAHGVSTYPFRALLSCWPLKPGQENIENTLGLIRRRAEIFQDELARSRRIWDVNKSPKSEAPNPPTVDLSVMLASTLFCLDRMPSNRSPLAFFLTDGVVSTPEGGAFENVLSSIARKDVVVHTVLVSCAHFHSDLPLGYCPDTDALELLAHHSGGLALNIRDFETCPCRDCGHDRHESAVIDLALDEMPIWGSASSESPVAVTSASQAAVNPPCLLSGSMFRHSSLSRHRRSVAAEAKEITEKSGASSSASSSSLPRDCFPWTGLAPSIPLFSLKVKEYVLDVSLSALLQCRVREGFKDGRVADIPESGISISLSLRWKPYITIEYKCLLENVHLPHKGAGLPSPRVTIRTLAPNEFLRKLQTFQMTKKPSSLKAMPSLPSPLLLLEHLQQLVKTDQLLVVLHGIRPESVAPVRVSPPSLRTSLAHHSGFKGRAARAQQQTQQAKTTAASADGSRAQANLAKFLNLSPVMWKRWLIVERLDVVCQVGLGPNCLPRLSKPELQRQFEQVSASLQSAVSQWSTAVHGKLYFKLLSPTPVSSPAPAPSAAASAASSNVRLRLLSRLARSTATPFCLLRLFWHSQTLASLHIAFFATSARRRQRVLTTLKQRLVKSSVRIVVPSTAEPFTTCSVSFSRSRSRVRPSVVRSTSIAASAQPSDHATSAASSSSSSMSASATSAASAASTPSMINASVKLRPFILPSPISATLLRLDAVSDVPMARLHRRPSSSNLSKTSVSPSPLSARSPSPSVSPQHSTPVLNTSLSSTNNALMGFRSQSNPNLVSMLAHSQSGSVSTTPSSSSPSLTSGRSAEFVDASLPKSVLRSYMQSKKRLFRIANSKTLSTFVTTVTNDRINEGFLLLYSDDSSQTFYREIDVGALKRSLLQFAICVASNELVFVEIWIEPLESVHEDHVRNSHAESVSRRLLSWYDQSMRCLLLSLNAFDRVFESSFSSSASSGYSQALGVPDYNKIESLQHSATSSTAYAPTSGTSFEFDLVPLLSSVSEPTFIPLEFPGQDCLRSDIPMREMLIETLRRVSSVEAVSNQCFATICDSQSMIISALTPLSCDGCSFKSRTSSNPAMDEFLSSLWKQHCASSSETQPLHAAVLFEIHRDNIAAPQIANDAMLEKLLRRQHETNKPSIRRAHTEPARDRDEGHHHHHHRRDHESRESITRLKSVLMRALKQAHQRNFARGVYANLIETGETSSYDFRIALSSCVEYTSLLDITSLMRSAVSGERLDHAFHSIMSSRFCTVPESDAFFYFQPKDATDSCSGFSSESDVSNDDESDDDERSSDDQGVSSDDDFVPHREDIDGRLKYRFPFFLRMECEVELMPESLEPSSSGGRVTVYPVKLSTTVSSLLGRGGPVRRALLRLYCLTLPVYEGADDATALSPLASTAEGMRKSHSMSSFRRTLSHSPAPSFLTFSQLPEDVRRRMVKVSRALRAAISEEMLNALLRAGNALFERTDEARTIASVAKHMARIRPEFLHEQVVPLRLAAPDMSKPQFAEELARTCFRRVRISSTSSCFYLPGPTPFIFKSAADVEPLSRSTSSIDHRPSRPVSSSPSSSSERERTTPDFWLLLSVDSSVRSVRIALHSAHMTGAQVTVVLAQARSIVEQTAQLVSQLSLLNLLHVTLSCSPLLIGESPTDPTVELDVAVAAADVPEHAFESGEFACPSQHTMELTLHERLLPAVALQALSDTALHPFAVTNRRHVFVYQEKTGSVCFLRISHSDHSRHSRSKQHSKQKALNAVDEDDEELVLSDENELVVMEDHSALGGGAGGAHHGEVLLVEVFGVQKPGDEICVELKALLESKIDAITLSILSSMLAKNPHFKWTKADLDMLRPRSSAPTAAFMLSLPRSIKDAYLFLLFLSQNLSRYLLLLHLAFETPSAAAVAAVASCSAETQTQTQREPQTEMMDDMMSDLQMARWSWEDFAFVYNHDRRFETSKMVGSGLCAVFCSLVSSASAGPVPLRRAMTHLNVSGDSSGAPVFIDDETDDSEMLSTFSSIAHRTDLPLVDGGIAKMADAESMLLLPSSSTSSSGSAIMFEMWTLGSVDTDVLSTMLEESFAQTLAEYRLEIVQKRLPSLSLALQSALQTQTDAVHHISADLPIASSLSDQVLREVRSIISAVCTSSIEWSEVDTDNSDKGWLGRAGNGAPPMLYPHVSVRNTVVLFERTSMALLQLRQRRLHVHTYNWRPVNVRRALKRISKLVSWARFRAHLLSNLVHQKLGLFRHVSTVPSRPLEETRVGACETRLVPPPSRGSNDRDKMHQARFTLENIGVLIRNHVPPRVSAVSDMSLSSPVSTAETGASPRSPNLTPASSSASGRSRSHLNRFELRRRLVHRSKIAAAASMKTRPQSGLSAPAAPLARLVDFGSVLKGMCPNAYQMRGQLPSSSSSNGDVLDLHGDAFMAVASLILKKREMATARRTARNMVMESTTSSAISRPSSPTSASTSESSVSSPSSAAPAASEASAATDEPVISTEVQQVKWTQMMLSDSRLIKAARAPFLFNKLRKMLFEQVLPSAGATAAPRKRVRSEMSREVLLHYRILESFLQEFVLYLEQVLKATLVWITTQNEEPVAEQSSAPSSIIDVDAVGARFSSPSAHIVLQSGELVMLKPIRVLLRKRIHAQMLLVEVRFQDMFACCNVYRVDSQSAGREDEMLPSHIEHAIVDTAAAIHMSSALYDFHVRHFHSFLADRSLQYPFFEMKEALQAFCRFFPHPPAYSRSHLIRRELALPIPASIDSGRLFSYLAAQAPSYHFRVRSMNIFASSSTRTFAGDHDTGDCFEYVMIVCHSQENQSENQSDMLVFEVYIARVDVCNQFPLTSGHGVIDEFNLQDQVLSDTVDQWATLAQYLFTTVADEAEAKLRLALQGCLRSFQRDLIWQKLVSVEAPAEASMTLAEHEMVAFDELISKKSFNEFDETLQSLQLLSAAVSRLICDQIRAFHPGRVREFVWKQIRHVVISYSGHENVCVILTIDESGEQRLRLWLCTREPVGVSAEERSLVSSAVNQVCYILWRSMLG